jgi:hypothetical protein
MDNNKKKVLKVFVVFACCLLSACQFIRVEKASFKLADPLQLNSKSQFIFNPSGKESFALKSKPADKQKAGYRRFCQNTQKLNCRNKLPYLRYVGLKGYFDTQKAIKTDNPNYEYHPVVLENGDKYFFLSLKSEGGKYGEKSSIKSLSFAENIETRPLMVHSSISIIGEYSSFGDTFLKLSNGQVITKQQLVYIKEISARSFKPSTVSELLLDTTIEHNEAYDSYLISPKGLPRTNLITMFIGLNEREPWLRFRVGYKGAKRLDLTAYSIVADDMTWRSPKLAFEKKKNTPQVIESFEVLANDREIRNVQALANASSASIQLHGDKKSVQETLKVDQKLQLANMITLYQLLAHR